MERSFEREIIPMARHEGRSLQFTSRIYLSDLFKGMALAPFRVLAGGKIRTDEEEERRRQTGEKGRTITGPDWERTEKERLVCNALEKVAKEVGAKYISSGM